MRKHIKYITLIVTTLISTLAFSQGKEQDTIKTGVIDVVKPYTPTISDAFKVKEIPIIQDDENTTKKDIKYNIFSFPVASTFTPAKGKAAVVEKAKPIKLYDNYATLGLGTYTTILGEVYLNHAINRTENVGGYISHNSSQGGIKGIELDDNYSDTKINANYASSLRDLTWRIEGGYQHQSYNWYGVPEFEVEDAKDDGIDLKHTFSNMHIGGDLTFEDTYINSGSVLFRRFSDNQGSAENRFIAKSKIDIPVNREEISTKLRLEYLSGGFEDKNTLLGDVNYGNFLAGGTPTYRLTKDDLTLDLGVSLYYLNDFEAGKSKFFAYPNITASYRLVDNILIAYGGVEGDLIQNTYHQFAAKNPFVSPNLIVAPTDQQYNAYVGLKGKLSSNMSYDISGSYVSDKNRALYKSNAVTTNTSLPFSYGNSFGIAYDDVTTFGVAGELNIDINRNFKLGIKGQYFSYSTDNEEEAWNLPDITGTLFLDYQVNEHWFAGANLIFVGERKDQLILNNTVTSTDTIILESFFDANAHLGYHINDQISIFAKANNIANNAYQRWQNFPVQSIQFLAGATYKFDF